MKQVDRLLAVAAITAATLLTAACASGSEITRTKTTMGAVDMTGLVCRRERSVDSHMPKTICASKEAWAKYDADQIAATERADAQFDKMTNVNQFGRR